MAILDKVLLEEKVDTWTVLLIIEYHVTIACCNLIKDPVYDLRITQKPA
jgi:hypothetical protein